VTASDPALSQCARTPVMSRPGAGPSPWA
jgi:hypothetical protein